MTRVGERIREELRYWGVTQAELARHIGVDVKVINRLCNGRTTLSNDVAWRLARALDTSYRVLVMLQAMDDEAALAEAHSSITPIRGDHEPA